MAEALDGIAAAAKANGVRDARPLITHLQLVSPADILGSGPSASSPSPSRSGS